MLEVVWAAAAAAVLFHPAPAGAEADSSGWAESFQYDAKGRRDPFVPLVRDGHVVTPVAGTPMPNAKPILYGILWDPGGPSIALIDDEELGVGGTVSGYRVAEIRQDAVVLVGGEESLVLQIAFDAPPDSSPSPKGR